MRPVNQILVDDHPSFDFLNYPLVMPPKGAVIRPTVERYLTSIGMTGAQGAVETVSLPIGRRIVQRSDYIWFISRGVVMDELLNGSLISCPLQSDLLAGPVGVFTLANATPMLNAAHLCKFCGICPTVCANKKATQRPPFYVLMQNWV